MRLYVWAMRKARPLCPRRGYRTRAVRGGITRRRGRGRGRGRVCECERRRDREQEHGPNPDDVHYPQKALTTRTRTEHTDVYHRHPTPIRTHAHLRSFRCTAGPAVQGLHLRREGLWGCVGQRRRHVARPAGTGRHATGRERLSPQNPARTHKHHHQRVRARQKKANIRKRVSRHCDAE